MVIFEDESERDYFNDRMILGEIARITLADIFEKLQTVDKLTKDEIIDIQKNAIDKLKAEVNTLNEQEKDGSFQEQADDLIKKADEVSNESK
jgi:hypothetical protein